MSDLYFRTLEQALKQAGCFRPVLVIDRDRLDSNISLMKAGLAPHLKLRIVDKSLPSLPLLAHVMRETGTNRIMSFHLPITLAVLAAFPEADVLYGKPMPVEAVEQAFARADPAMRRALSTQVTWLIDDGARLDAWAALAERADLSLRIAFEVDVGMHRGGLAEPEAFAALLHAARAMPRLSVQGLMGYEAHIPKIPGFAGGPSGEKARVIARFLAFAAHLRDGERNVLNTGGSKTTLTYDAQSKANDVSAGSALLLPSDFDTPGLAGFEPAAFIVTPALKVVDTVMPGSPLMTRLFRRLGLIPTRNAYLYGGAWMAKPVYPAGLSEHKLWGRSSNQQFLAMEPGARLSPGDLVFLRPTQSEAVLQQFGPLLVYSGGQVVEDWPALPTG